MTMPFTRTRQPTQRTITTASLADLEEMAKERGAAAGLYGVEEDFTAAVETPLHCMFVREHGALGTAPEMLHAKWESLADDLERVTKRLAEHQRRRDETVECGKDGARLNFRLCLGIALICGLAGVVCRVFGVELMWWGWSMLGLLAVLMMLALHALPTWASSVRYYLDYRMMLRRAKRLERRINRLKEVEWREIELRNRYDQFIEFRTRLLVGIYQFYKASGQSVANHQGMQRSAAA
jgi:hypothetical protein